MRIAHMDFESRPQYVATDRSYKYTTNISRAENYDYLSSQVKVTIL